MKIAAKVAEHAYKTGLATVLPEPKDKIATITEGLYSPEYISFVPRTYVWWNAKNFTLSRNKMHTYPLTNFKII